MSRFSWILLILLVILAVSQLWMMDNREAPSWTKCKENLLMQTITGNCTLREGFKLENSESEHVTQAGRLIAIWQKNRKFAKFTKKRYFNT